MRYCGPIGVFALLRDGLQWDAANPVDLNLSSARIPLFQIGGSRRAEICQDL
jgi:hypothetical protein